MLILCFLLFQWQHKFILLFYKLRLNNNCAWQIFTLNTIHMQVDAFFLVVIFIVTATVTFTLIAANVDWISYPPTFLWQFTFNLVNEKIIFKNQIKQLWANLSMFLATTEQRYQKCLVSSRENLKHFGRLCMLRICYSIDK